MKDMPTGINLGSLIDEEFSAEELAWDHAMDISGSVYSRMRELSMSNKELAEKLGVTAGRVSQIIKGYTGMSLKVLAKLEVALDFRLDKGFFYMPHESGVTATAEIPVRDSANETWASRVNCDDESKQTLAFSAIKGGLYAA